MKGLGGGVKGKFVRQVIQQQEVLLLCIQKTKKGSIDKSLCFAMWGNSNMDWVVAIVTIVYGKSKKLLIESRTMSLSLRHFMTLPKIVQADYQPRRPQDKIV